MKKSTGPFSTKDIPTVAAARRALKESPAKVQEEIIDPVRKYLSDKALENVKAMQRDSEIAEEPLDRFTIKKYLVGLAGYTEKQSIEHSGRVQFQPFKISRGDE